MLTTGLFATDCIEYQAQQIKYEEKASKNKLMSKRYTSIANRYESMYKNCIIEEQISISLPVEDSNTSNIKKYVKSLSFDDKVEKSLFDVEQKVFVPAGSSYRINPNNSIK